MVPSDDAAERLNTTAVAAATGYSTQQIRDLESLGVIALAPRSGNGYRRFSPAHVRDLRAYRDLAAAVGPVEARRVMRAVRTLPADRAAALVSSLHTGVSRERDEALAAREALRAVHGEAAVEAAPVDADAMTISELAEALGVRASTLRFWEKSGLVSPDRLAAPAGPVRRYPLPAIREARITAALRAAGYRIPDVAAALDAVRRLGDTAASLDALQVRLDDIARRTLALLRAGGALAGIIAAAASRAEGTGSSVAAD
jgi:DNA-binding transcriptional MerR regulator